MNRVLLALLMLLLGGAGPAPPPAAPTPAAGLTAAEAQKALEVLRDPVRRDQMISVLEAVAKAAPESEVKSAAPAAALVIPLAPDSLGAQVLMGASERIKSFSSDVVQTVRTVTDFPLLWGFVVTLSSDPWAQALLLSAGWKLLVAMAAGLAAQWAVRRLLTRPGALLAEHANRGRGTPERIAGLAEAERGQTERIGRRIGTPLMLLRRVAFALGRLVLELLPVLAFLAAGYAALGLGLGEEPIARLVMLGVLHSYALCRVASGLTRTLVGPGEPRLYAMPDEAAGYTLRWVRRIAAIGIFGYALAEVGLLFGLYRIAHDALIKIVVLAVHACLIIVVLQRRGVVAGWLHAREGATGLIALLRNGLAGLWHFVAIFYLLALWAVWALDVQHGFSRLLRVVVITAVIVTVARMVLMAVLGVLSRVTKLPPEIAERHPGLGTRVDAYHPVARVVVKAVVFSVAFVLVAEAWGLDALTWFDHGALGGRMLGALTTVAVTVVLGLAVWEATNAAIARHLARLAREAQLARSARLRTLLPMVRTALMVSICLVAGLMVLSEIGVNIAPLLAGAGVIGLAIGFGSQKLVQDIITGLFLLLENAMQVGDAVSLGGMSGTVENLSVRTIRLRALDGSVHIVPFSAVTTVTNMTRDYGYAVIDVEVGVNEEPDRIAEVLHEIASEMRKEARWASAIREDLDVMGVEKFVPQSWVLRARIKTLPAQRWAVGRELNRRIKYRFDALAIESPMTSYRVLHMPTPAFPLPVT